MASQHVDISMPEKRGGGELPCRANNESVNESSSRDEAGKGEMSAELTEYPEGGPRAWLDATGAAGVLFCTSGYINAFGCVDLVSTHL